MDPISPVLADAFDLLRADLYHHLCEAESVAERQRVVAGRHRRGAQADSRPGGRHPRTADGTPGDTQWRVPGLLVGVALPGSDNDPRAGEGFGPGVRRARPPGEW
jgi:hypothetical protein